ncbi:hypothetical protein [Chishuiella sp.]|uniref:hypothetical protein n=1 Tax=Chishuiella sp. TaxID=1969467 RepID=UPI0028AABA68|nr:hypothetical protein [Chishuiella sp.]
MNNKEIRGINALIRVLDNEQYAKDFVEKGHIRFSILKDIVEKGKAEMEANGNKLDTHFRYDPFDGAKKINITKLDNGNTFYNAEYHDYSKCLCLYNLDISHFNNDGKFIDFTNSIKEFGEYVIFIHKPIEFLEKIINLFYKSYGIYEKDFVLGNCVYKDIINDEERSFFDKTISYTDQKEFRIGSKQKSEFITLGDISQLAFYKHISYFNLQTLDLSKDKKTILIKPPL